MNPHDWYIEHRLDFVSRTLDAGEERSFADHLRGCEECAAAVRTLEREFAWLPIGATPVRPRPGFRREIVHGILGERRPVWRRWAGVAAVAVAVAASLLLAVGAYFPAKRETLRLSSVLATRTAELSALRDSLSIMHQAARVLQASIAMDGHHGGMLIFADDVSHRWNVVVHGLPPAPPGETYQFWFICSDGMVRGATVTADPSRPAFITLGMPKKGGVVVGAALTMESTTNVALQPHGKQLAHVMM